MDVNELLRISLKQDLQILIELVEKEGPELSQKYNIKSWLFPSKNYDFITSFVATNEVFQAGTEKLLLELIIDRVYVLISIIFERIKQVNCERECCSRYILAPKHMTLGCNFRKFWDYTCCLLDTMQTKCDTCVPSLSPSSIHQKSTQTDIIALNKCDSCASAILCMKNLLTVFDEDVLKDINLRPRLFDITQFGCMLQTTTSISKSVGELLRKLADKDRQNTLLRNKNATLEKTNESNRNKIAMLERETEIYKGKLRYETAKSLSLLHCNEELSKGKKRNEAKIISLAELTRNITSSLEQAKTTASALKEENKMLSRYNEKISTYKTFNRHQLSVNEEKFSILEARLDGFAGIMNVSENLIDSVNARLDNLARIQGGNEMRIENITRDMNASYEEIYERFSELRSKLKERLIEMHKADIERPKSAHIPKYEIKGDPLEDISGQIEENDQKIASLQEDNEKLSKLLSKFKKFS